MEKKKGNDRQNMKEEVGPELNPDDLDLREDNDLTEEQSKNSPQKSKRILTRIKSKFIVHKKM